MKRLHLGIAGRVQGVAYRAYTMREARSLGLTGWVRNLPDGRVELLAEGEESQLRRLVDWCRVGPPVAHVTDIEEEWLDFVGELKDFTIRYA